MSEIFREKINQLQKEINKLEANLVACSGTTQCKILMIVAGITPIIIFLTLYLASPGFVTNIVKKKTVLSIWKVSMWTSIITLVIWLMLYGYTYTSMYA